MLRGMRSERPAPVRREVASLRGESLRIVAVADTHGSPHPAASRLVAAERPDLIVHAGDIGGFAVLDALASIAPVFAVRGNVDAPAREIPEALTLEVRDGEATLVKLLLVHVGVDGPRIRRDAARLAASEGASIVVCGHSHVPYVGNDRGLSVINPGSVGPRRFRLPIVFGVVDVTRTGVRVRHVDCETGATWSPVAAAAPVGP